jgi:pimeloyl-ACP methyl ester carboxylesterase
MTALADDVARLRQVLARQKGPTLVVGHSYGGQIITALGAGAPNVPGRSPPAMWRWSPTQVTW